MNIIKSFFTSPFNATIIDIYLLGMCISMAAINFPWSYAMRTHFYEFLADMILSTVMYGCLMLCVAEMMSALPFSGGIYGLARVALSPYIGFLVGILETFKNVFHITCCVLPLSGFVISALHDNLAHQPIYWIVILGSTGLICIIGGRFFWNFNRLMGLTCIALILMYLCTPMLNKTDFKLYANTNLFHQPVDNFSVHDMFQFSPVATWFYVGIEILPFTCIDSKTATKSVPYAMIGVFLTVLIFSFGAYLAACSQFPGAYALHLGSLPLMFGYADMLGMTYEHACWFPITCIFASVFAFMFGCGRQISSLSSSKLLPSFLQWKTMYSETPYMAIITTGLLVFFTLCILRYKLNNDISILFFNAILGSYFSYISVFVTYIQFKRKYITLKREFFNPLGIYGAIVGIIICLILSSCILGLQKGTKIVAAPITIAIVVGIGSVYYFAFASKKQYYSEEEQKAFLITYVINNNKRGRKKNMMKKHHKNVPGALDRFASILSLTKQRSDSSLSLSSTAHKYLSFLSSPSNMNNATIIKQDDESIGTNGLEPFHFTNPHTIEDQKVNDCENIPSKQLPTNETNETHLPTQEKHKKLSIDFSQLPSMEVLKHIHEEIELKQHPNQTQSIKTKEQHLDFLPHTSGLLSSKIIPTNQMIEESNQDIDLEAN